MNHLPILLTILLSGEMYHVEYNTDRTVTVNDHIRVDEATFMGMKEAVRSEQARLNRHKHLVTAFGEAALVDAMPAEPCYAMQVSDADLD
jgi:hypothetical protein